MATPLDAATLKPMHRLLSEGILAGLNDGQLLQRFVADRDDLAFAALVERHGPMVWSTCRRHLADLHDLEDAFQATFLVLVRKARSLRAEGTLGPWLHGVSRRIAARVKMQRTRREISAEWPASSGSADAHQDLERAELLAAIDDEIARLPGKYRRAAVLCDLEGLSHAEAASQLACPVGTVKSRLARARSKLRSRLLRRGLAPAVAVLGAPLAEARASVRMSSTLAKSTLSVAQAAAWGRSDRRIPRQVATLASAGGPRLQTPWRVVGVGLTLTAGLAGARFCWISASPPAPSATASGLVREDQAQPPWAIAPRELAACGGHGSILMYALDQHGNRQAKEKPENGNRPAEWQEEWRELHWVVVTGIVDHRKLRERYAQALEIDLAAAHPHYRRAELQRQERLADQSWSPWQIVPASRKQQILRNIPEADAELAPAEIRLDALVDMIPFSRQGAWRGVNVDWLIAVEQARPNHDQRANARCPRGFELTDARAVMIRSIDFTVEPGKIYRYRARIVVSSPDENPEAKPADFAGLWSDPAPEVLVPRE